MRRCPECETLYEDHVDTCLVDGADLVQVEDAGSISMQRTGSFSQQLSGSHLAVPTDEVPNLAYEPTQEEEKRQSRLPLLLGLVVLLFGFGGVALAGVVFLSQSGGPPPPPPVPAAVPEPEPPPPPAPAPEPEPEVQEFTLTTIPSNATVHENGQLVCRTPCVLEHPPDAPLPRAFSIEHEGYVAQVYTVTQASGNHQISLSETPRPRPVRVSSAPRPARPTPAPAAPQPAPEPAASPEPRRTLGGNRDLKNPFNR